MAIQIGTEGDHVPKARSDFGSHDLHSLKNFAWGTSVPQELSSGVLPIHWELLRRALSCQISLFSGFFADTLPPPLWIRLLRTNAGLRNVSPAYFAFANRLVRQFGGTLESIANSANSDQALSLGLLDNVTDRTSLSQFTALRLTITLAASPELESQIVSCADLKADEKLTLRTFLWAQLATLGLDHGLTPTREIEEAFSVLSGEESLDPVRLIHIHNSLNLLDFKAGDLDSVERRLDTIGTKLSLRVGSADVRAHVEGIHHFHRYLVAIHRDSIEDAEAYLDRAIERDVGFFDYHYRKAVHLHDRGDLSAQIEYEKALAVSAFDDSLVNDYGVFLNETGQHDLLQSWTRVAEWVFGESAT